MATSSDQSLDFQPKSSESSSRSRSQQVQDDDSETPDNVHLCVFFSSGNLGAAIFDPATNVLMVANSIDEGPDYKRLRNLFGQVIILFTVRA